MNSLSFNAIQFHPIQQNDEQIWISSTELAKALDYKQVDAVTKVYNRNSDEFTEKMTQVIDNSQAPNLGVRIFSLRGCHLIAMFARTAIAKQFRKWVLDILDREVQPKHKTHKSERTSLHDAHALLVAKTKHLSSSDAWKLIHQRFNVNHIEEIPYDMIPVAVEYVHHLIALMSNKNGTTGLDTNVRAMAIYLAWLSGWWRQFGPAVRGINPHMAAAIHDYFNDGGFVAWSFIEKDKRAELHKRIDTHPWHLPPMDRYHLLNRN
ncbi:Bro-N domain-containing protein [Acinetobacter calcoaceticus]|uniref:BRO-N domain-containing protein n=1 Tax=Acinetobacter calcoaceticus TaxID=471 RepID=UPI003A85B7EA